MMAFNRNFMQGFALRRQAALFFAACLSIMRRFLTAFAYAFNRYPPFWI